MKARSWLLSPCIFCAHNPRLAFMFILMASTLDWTIVHPTMLTNGPRTERYRAGEHLPLRGIPRISRADTADFLLSQLDDRTYVRKIVVVSD